MPTDAILVYITAGDAEEASDIARTLVRDRLAACVNILAPHTAIYRGDSGLTETEETALLVKTTAELFDALCARVRAMHSYENPAILALPVEGGDASFLDWVRGQVAEERPQPNR